MHLRSSAIECPPCTSRASSRVCHVYYCSRANPPSELSKRGRLFECLVQALEDLASDGAMMSEHARRSSEYYRGCSPNISNCYQGTTGANRSCYFFFLLFMCQSIVLTFISQTQHSKTFRLLFITRLLKS